MSTNERTRRAETLASEQRDGRKLTDEEALLRDAGPDHRTTSDVDPDRLAKALRWLAYAREWRIDNAPAWLAFEAYALQCESEGKLLSGGVLYAILKRHDFVSLRTGKTTTLNRTVIPLFVRWLLREHPGLRAELRRSFFDLLFLSGEVGDNADKR